METDSVPAVKADKAADPAEETEWPKKQKLFEQTIIVVGATKKNRVSSTILLQRNFPKKTKKDVGEMRRHLFCCCYVVDCGVFAVCAVLSVTSSSVFCCYFDWFASLSVTVYSGV